LIKFNVCDSIICDWGCSTIIITTAIKPEKFAQPCNCDCTKWAFDTHSTSDDNRKPNIKNRKIKGIPQDSS
jgi:hypothetical protein